MNRLAQLRDGLERALLFDSWGQMVEAATEYESLAKDTQTWLQTQHTLSEESKKNWIRVAVVLSMRAKSAEDLTGSEVVMRLEDVRKVQSWLQEIMTNPLVPFPVDNDAIRRQVQANFRTTVMSPQKAKAAVVQVDNGSDEEEVDNDDVKEKSKGGSTLKPMPQFEHGTAITITIDRIKLKDPGQYIEPFFTVSLKDSNGYDIAPPQDTPVTNQRDEFIHFNQPVYLQVPLEKLPEDCAVFFEFKHYKPKKTKLSTKCFCFMEKDELKKGAVPLEIYAKPTDFKRKKLNLLTEKQHYMYVTVSLHKI